jgi:hypothetical protein
MATKPLHTQSDKSDEPKEKDASPDPVTEPIVGAHGMLYGDSPIITEPHLMNEEDVQPTLIAPAHVEAPPVEPDEEVTPHDTRS